MGSDSDEKAMVRTMRCERLYTVRESHMMGASLTLFLYLLHPYAAAAHVLLVLVLWLHSVWQMRHHPTPVTARFEAQDV